MHRFLVLALVIVSAASCSDPLLSKPPKISGNVAGTSSNRLLVVAPGGSVACDITQHADVLIDRASIVRRSGGSATAADLVVGTRVSVWGTEMNLDVCPGRIGARVVVIEDAAR